MDTGDIHEWWSGECECGGVVLSHGILNLRQHGLKERYVFLVENDAFHVDHKLLHMTLLCNMLC